MRLREFVSSSGTQPVRTSLSVIYSLLVVFFIVSSCSTPPTDHRSATADPGASPISTPSDPSPEEDAPEDHLSIAFLARRLETHLPHGLEVARDGHKPMIVRTSPGRALGIVRSRAALYVMALEESDLLQPDGDRSYRPWLQEVSGPCSVGAFHPRRIGRRPSDRSPYGGFEAILSCARRDLSLFAIDRDNSSDAAGAFVFTELYSTVSRTILRDLNGDSVPEIVRYSRVFETEGPRELLLEALRWDGEGLEPIASAALLRRINARFERLEGELGDPASGILSLLSPHELDRALVPAEDAPPASSLLPAETVRIPRIVDIALQLGVARWVFDHEIALEENVYRIRVHVEANPLIDELVRIEALDQREENSQG